MDCSCGLEADEHRKKGLFVVQQNIWQDLHSVREDSGIIQVEEGVTEIDTERGGHRAGKDAKRRTRGLGKIKHLKMVIKAGAITRCAGH